MNNIHKEFPLSDEELGCRHGAETLVGGDEEEGAHPVTNRSVSLYTSFYFTG